MNRESLDYWLPIIIGLPQALLWLGIVLVLASVAAGGDSPRTLRRIAISAAITCAVVAAVLGGVLFWRPVWYAPWIEQLLFLLILGCFGVALNCLIWRKNPPKSHAERRRHVVFATFVGILTTCLYVSVIVDTGWSSVLFLVPYGILLAVGCVIFHRSQRRIKSTVPVWGVPLLLVSGASMCLPGGVAAAGESAADPSVQTAQSTEQDLHAALEGKWVSRSIDGTAVEEPITIEFRGDEVDNLFHDAEGNWHVLNFRVFAHEPGPAIDVWADETPLHGFLRQRGIYHIEGNTLTIVFQPKLDARQRSPWVDDDGRPTTFDPEHVVRRVFKRANATADEG